MQLKITNDKSVEFRVAINIKEIKVKILVVETK